MAYKDPAAKRAWKLAWYHANKASIRAYRARPDVQEAKRQYDRAYTKNNRHKARARQAKYRKAHLLSEADRKRRYLATPAGRAVVNLNKRNIRSTRRLLSMFATVSAIQQTITNDNRTTIISQ